MRIKLTIMKKLLTTACLFVVTTVAIVSFIASTVFGQEQKTADVSSSSLDSLKARVDKLFAPWDKPDSPGCALGVYCDSRNFLWLLQFGCSR